MDADKLTDLWKAINYTTPLPYIKSGYIYEYDLSKANISALFYNGIIDESKYKYYYNMEKQKREVAIGLMIRDNPELYKNIKDGIIDAKRMFVQANGIQTQHVVSVKNDAMFVTGVKATATEFPPFKFNLKNIYKVFMSLDDIEIYYSDNIKPNGNIDTTIDVKGISDEVLPMHENGMLGLICEICYRILRDHPANTVGYMSNMYNKFINRQLGIDFYRSFDSISGFKIPTYCHTFYMDTLDENMIPVVDINRNLSIMRSLMFVVSDIYRKSIKI